MDLFSLRQTAPDAWDSREVVALIEAIGRIIIQVDRPYTYLTRSFCILEAFSGIQAADRRDFQIDVRLPDLPLCSRTWCKDIRRKSISVQSQHATTRELKDKELIDSFIVQAVGFEKIDSVLTENQGFQGGIGCLKGTPQQLHSSNGDHWHPSYTNPQWSGL